MTDNNSYTETGARQENDIIKINEHGVSYMPEVKQDIQGIYFFDTNLRLVARCDGKIFIEAHQDIEIPSGRMMYRSTEVNLTYAQLVELKQFTEQAIAFLDEKGVV